VGRGARSGGQVQRGEGQGERGGRDHGPRAPAGDRRGRGDQQRRTGCGGRDGRGPHEPRRGPARVERHGGDQREKADRAAAQHIAEPEHGVEFQGGREGAVLQAEKGHRRHPQPESVGGGVPGGDPQDDGGEEQAREEIEPGQ